MITHIKMCNEYYNMACSTCMHVCVIIEYYTDMHACICCEFDGGEIHCKELCGVLEIAEPGLFHQQQKVEEALFSDGTKTSFKPLILLRGRMKCCGKKVSIR